MAASSKLAQSRGIQQISKHGVLCLWGFGVRLQMRNGHLSAEWGIGKERYEVCLPRVNRNLRRIIIVGSDGLATFDAIGWIADINASLIFLDRRGKLLFASTPTAPSDVRLRRAQALALENGTALKISRELISQKLQGQAAIVRDMLGNSVAADVILRFKAELAEIDNIDAVRLVESKAARLFWGQWADVPIRWPRRDEHRVSAHWKFFGSRISPITHSPRLAANPPNACMNLIHALCEAECRIALIAMGLDPEIGVLHCDAPNRSSLANDLQEVLRPKVDSFVLNWIQTEVFRKADFWEDRNGNCRIVSSLAIKLCETADTWRRLVAPIAEWVAQAQWDSTRKPPSEIQDLPTRLTQQRRTEGRGKEFVPSAVPEPRIQRVCPVCGTATKRGRHCLRCAKEISGEKLTELAKKGRIATLGAAAQKKRSETQKRHEAAKREWRLSQRPIWPGRSRYDREIRPRLPPVPISKISATLGICESYAADIRAGRHCPHPRHWEALAELVGYLSRG